VPYFWESERCVSLINTLKSARSSAFLILSLYLAWASKWPIPWPRLFLAKIHLAIMRILAGPFVFLAFVLLILPPTVAAFSQANFTLFKNSPFGACNPSNNNSFSPPTGQSASSGGFYSTNALTATQFCNSFWNYTVIPTQPTDAAFSFTWVSCLSNCISFLISSFLLYHTTSLHCNADYQDVLHAKEESQPFYLTPSHPVKSDLGRLFWVSLIYDSFKTILWWYSFLQLVRNPASASRISLLQWITIYQYRVTLRYTLPPKYFWLCWLPAVLAVAQFAASVFAAILMNNALHPPINGDFTITAVTYNLTQGPFFSLSGSSTSCTAAEAAKAVLLIDPAAPLRQLIYFVGSLIAVVLFVPSMFVELRGGNTRRFMWAYQVYATGAVQGIMALALALVRLRSTPLSWNDTCAIVHIMMVPNFGYWDVDLSRFWRILKAWFNV
jgi:hypothetical protein